jgi:translation initiation factor 2 subunit 1
MLFKKQGFPEENEIIICTVKKILHSAVFAHLEEYGRDGMINISEVSAGRIRNLRDYVTEGKKIVCKIIRINREKGHIDLSLRRVNQAQRINKNKEYKNEIKAVRILENISKTLKKDLKELYQGIGSKLIGEYGSLFVAFQSIAEDNNLIKKFNLDSKLEKSIIDIVNERIKPEEISIKAKINLKSEEIDGIEKIKIIFSKIVSSNVLIRYVSAPRYDIKITAKDYKQGESILKKVNDTLTEEAKQNKCEMELERV